jgi:hypothetical protein
MTGMFAVVVAAAGGCRRWLREGLLKLWEKLPTLLEMMATESGRPSPPKFAIRGRGACEGRRGGSLGSMAASLCLRRASSWARAFCLRLILLADRVRWPLRSPEVLLWRRKLKLERREAACWKSVVDWAGVCAAGRSSEALGRELAAGGIDEAMVGWASYSGRGLAWREECEAKGRRASKQVLRLGWIEIEPGSASSARGQEGEKFGGAV